MHFTPIATLALAATAFASPLEQRDDHKILISLPVNCSTSDLASEYLLQESCKNTHCILPQYTQTLRLMQCQPDQNASFTW